MKKAFITGIAGQDGSYLAEFLLKKGYEVHGMLRRIGIENQTERISRIEHIQDKIKLYPGTLESYSRVIDILEEIKPDECYHLAAQSFVQESFDDSFSTLNININGTHHVLSALHKRIPKCKFYFAATSEMFGKVKEIPQTENTPFHPRSPYGISKMTGFELTRNYRESYGMFACSGILFNHESPRRGQEFVTRKITSTIADIKNGKTNVLILGNLDAKRDWGFAGDYIEAMWLMLQQPEPKDYVISTGQTHSVMEFINQAFNYVGLSFEVLDLHDLSEDVADKKIQELKQQKDKIYVVQHPKFYRPAEVDMLIGDCTLAKKELGWEPKTKFEELIKMMMDSDLKVK